MPRFLASVNGVRQTDILAPNSLDALQTLLKRYPDIKQTGRYGLGFSRPDLAQQWVNNVSFFVRLPKPADAR